MWPPRHRFIMAAPFRVERDVYQSIPGSARGAGVIAAAIPPPLSLLQEFSTSVAQFSISSGRRKL
jgi:hypothetical protein